MTSDWGADFAADLVDVFTDGIDITAPTDVYVTLYDDTGSELNASLSNGRVQLSVPGGLVDGADATEFENAAEIDFGENTTGGLITVQEFALKDQDADDATATEYVRADITNAPQDFADTTRVYFPAGDLNVDILEN